MSEEIMKPLVFIFQFLVLMGVVTGGLIFVMKKMFFSRIETAKNQLDEQSEAARQKQAELNRKIKEADEELNRRRSEADALAKKMVTEAEEKVKEEREKIIHKARAEGEEIITKAQMTKDKIRKEIEMEMELKAIAYATNIVNHVLDQKGRGALDRQLQEDFLQGLEKIDMSQLNSEVGAAEVITVSPVDSMVLDRIAATLKSKLKKDLQVTNRVDPQYMAGIVLKLGTLGLDGSLRNMIKESAGLFKQKVEGA